MRHLRLTSVVLGLALAGSAALLAACSDSFDNTFDLNCQTTFTDEGGLLLLSIVGSCGSGVTFGTLDVASEEVLVQGAGSSVTISGIALLVDADGNTLEGSFVGEGQLYFDEESEEPDSVVFSGTETYTGASGSFEGASGSASVTGSANFRTGTLKYTTIGTLTANNNEFTQ